MLKKVPSGKPWEREPNPKAFMLKQGKLTENTGRKTSSSGRVFELHQLVSTFRFAADLGGHGQSVFVGLQGIVGVGFNITVLIP